MYEDTCQFCDSMNVRCGEVNPDTKRFQVFCRDCGKTWEEEDTDE